MVAETTRRNEIKILEDLGKSVAKGDSEGMKNILDNGKKKLFNALGVIDKKIAKKEKEFADIEALKNIIVNTGENVNMLRTSIPKKELNIQNKNIV